MGRSNEDPLPPILNNKFDALPPAEGLVYDFVFDFKARGQWKHWNDLVKNMDNPEVLTPLTIIPTIDTGIFFVKPFFLHLIFFFWYKEFIRFALGVFIKHLTKRYMPISNWKLYFGHFIKYQLSVFLHEMFSASQSVIA